MSVAQRLYENGYITYMRTDSTTLSESAINAARSQARQLYGAEYVPDAAAALHPQGQERAGGARGDPARRRRVPHPGAGGQRAAQRRVPALRADLAAHRRLADGRRPRHDRLVRLGAPGPPTAGAASCSPPPAAPSPSPASSRPTSRASTSSAGGEADDAESRLPELDRGPAARASTTSRPTATPPARRPLHRGVADQGAGGAGIGRPSTYASIIKTIQDRGYVHKKGSALVPSWVAFAVIRLLEQHFGRLVDYDFTAAMEDELDEIAAGQEQRGDVARQLLLRQAPARTVPGAPPGGAEEARRRQPRRHRRPRGQLHPARRAAIVVRVGRNGPYLEDAGRRTASRAGPTSPTTCAPDELTLEMARELLADPAARATVLGVDPETGHEIVAKDGRYGPYVTEVLPRRRPEERARPRTASRCSSRWTWRR